LGRGKGGTRQGGGGGLSAREVLGGGRLGFVTTGGDNLWMRYRWKKSVFEGRGE